MNAHTDSPSERSHLAEGETMSIPRWEVDGSLEPSRGFGTEVVLYSDHVSAVEAARTEERDGLMDEMIRRFTGNREQAIDDCIAVVPEEICTCATWKPYHFEWCSITRVNAALRTLKEQP